MKTMNLGIANRNPLNIRYVKANHWLGLHPQTPNVKGFCHLTAPAYGFRAAIILIKNYMRKYGCVTPGEHYQTVGATDGKQHRTLYRLRLRTQQIGTTGTLAH